MRFAWVGLCVGVFLVAHASSLQDPVAVDPARHAVVVENDQVRVLRITMKPGDKTPSHQHPASVAIWVSDAALHLTGTGVPADQSPRKKGDILLVEPTTHVVENTGKETSEIILVELKKPAAGKPIAKGAVEADPKHYEKLAENDRVRVLRARYGPGEKSVMHEHPALVAVALTPVQMLMHLADSKTEKAQGLKQGEALFMEPANHAPENLSKTAADVILVELKPR